MRIVHFINLNVSHNHLVIYMTRQSVQNLVLVPLKRGIKNHWDYFGGHHSQLGKERIKSSIAYLFKKAEVGTHEFFSFLSLK